MRTALLLVGIGCVALASLIFFGFDLDLLSEDIREDGAGWAWLGVALIAASTLPWELPVRRWFDKDA